MTVLERVKRIAHGPSARLLARFGLASRAIVYLPLAVLMIELAAGGRTGETDQGGTLRDLGRTTVGTVFLGIFAIGALCYTAWRWSEAIFGLRLEHLSRRDRLKAFVEGACYLPFGVIAFSVAAGDSRRSHQAGTYRTASAQAMHTVPGRVLVAAVGVVIVAVGCFLFSEGPRRSFADNLDLSAASQTTRRVTVVSGVVGSITRGIVFAFAGVLTVLAAVTASPAKAGGVDAALRTVVRVPAGRYALVVAAVGIAAFGVFALAEARWRRID